MKKIYTLFILLCCSALIACTPDISSNHYIAENVGRAQRVQYGKIVKASRVQVSAHNAESGSLIGTVAGATAGSAIGGTTRVNILGALGGAVLGGITGHEMGKQTGNQTGIQYIIRLDNRKTISIVQGLDPKLCVGQRVMVLTGGGARDRVIAG